MVALGGEHATVAGGGGGAGTARAAGQGHLGVVRQGAVAHPGDHDGDVQLDWLFGVPRTKDGLRGTAFAIAFERDAREPAGDEGEVVEGGPGARPQRAEAADAVTAEFRLDLDVLND